MEVCRANDPGETIAGGSAGSSSLEMVSKRKIRDLGPAKERLNTTNSLAGFPFSNFTTQFFVPEEFGHFVLCKVLFRDQRERANSKAVRAFHALLWQLFAQISSENEEYVARNAQLGISLTGFPEEGVVAHGAEDGGNGENLLEEVKNQAVKLHDDMFQRRYKIVFDCMYEYDSTYGRGRFEREVLRFMRICPIYQMPYTAVGKRKVYRNY